MQAELSFIDLFLGASLVVQLVMIILFVLAGTSWWFIFDKWLTLSRARKDIYEFETDFWNSKNIEKILMNSIVKKIILGYLKFLLFLMKNF